MVRKQRDLANLEKNRVLFAKRVLDVRYRCFGENNSTTLPGKLLHTKQHGQAKNRDKKVRSSILRLGLQISVTRRVEDQWNGRTGSLLTDRKP